MGSELEALHGSMRRTLRKFALASLACALLGGFVLLWLVLDSVLWYPALELGWGLLAVGVLGLVTSVVIALRDRSRARRSDAQDAADPPAR